MNTVNRVSLFIMLLSLVFSVGIAAAAVTGDCVNCHTMHNSQDGVAISGTPEANLLNADCVGCHSSGTASSIINLGTSRVPIVFNTTVPTAPLAGGNFYWVTTGDEFGHNVLVSNPDDNLPAAPGGTNFGGSGTCYDCHGSLATEKSGCLGCHVPAHHYDDGVAGAATAGDGWYRFLGYAMNTLLVGTNGEVIASYPGVTGIEDPDWEETPSETAHNVYKGTTVRYGASSFNGYDNNSIGELCAGCHADFHHDSFTNTGLPHEVAGGIGGLDGNPWLRHPSDVELPPDGEYGAYDTYNPLAPVAFDDMAVGVQSSITAARALATPVVTCISCHRAHGSPNADMLRWDYASCTTGSANSACGCFVCHTGKD